MLKQLKSMRSVQLGPWRGVRPMKALVSFESPDEAAAAGRIFCLSLGLVLLPKTLHFFFFFLLEFTW